MKEVGQGWRGDGRSPAASGGSEDLLLSGVHEIREWGAKPGAQCMITLPFTSALSPSLWELQTFEAITECFKEQQVL